MYALWQQISRFFNQKVYDFCDIETIEGEYLVARDGSLASIIEIEGSIHSVDSAYRATMGQKITQTLSHFIQDAGHQIQVVFIRDEDVSPLLHDIIARKKRTATQLDMDFAALMDEQQAIYQQHTQNERCYWVLWSRPQLLHAAQIEQTQKNAQEQRKTLQDALKHYEITESQYPCLDTSLLANAHQVFLQKTLQCLQEAGILAAKLAVDAMLYAIKRHVLPSRVTPTWQASYPSKPVPMRWQKNIKPAKNDNAINMLYPGLAKQLLNAPAYEGAYGHAVDETLVTFGDRTYIPLHVEMMPSDVHFDALFKELHAIDKLPYSLSFLIQGGALLGFSLNHVLASFTAYLSFHNQSIHEAKKMLVQAKAEGLPINKLNISVMTWVNADEESVHQAKKIALRKSLFIKTLQNWGGMLVVDKVGSPMKALQENALALSYTSSTQTHVAPLHAILDLLPNTRPASVWQEGHMLYRSVDGKLLPQQRFSSHQTTWVTVIVGRPGFGKSVLMNDLHLELCLLDGLQSLPYICIIDVGASSRGVVELLQASLGAERSHLAMYARLQNTREFAINPFDTPLGCRFPLAKDKSYLINFLSILATPAERQGLAYQGMSDLLSRLIDVVYQQKSGLTDRSYPHRYTYGHQTVLDQYVDDLGLDAHNLSYWDLVDILFERGHHAHAELAQRYAVPLLDDLIAAVASHDIQEEFANAYTEQGAPILAACEMGLRGAIGNFPVLANVTQFDVGSSRVMSLDLNDITTSAHTPNDYKQNALMYMMARQAFVKKVAFTADDLASILPLYKNYYVEKIQSLTDAKKTLCFDEYHRTGNMPAIEKQTLTDARESRKWQMELIIASQFLEDVGDISRIATNILICDAGTPSSRAYVAEKIGLNDAQEALLNRHVHGPKSTGMTFLAIQDHRSHGKLYQLYTLSLGAQRMWALSSTAEDRRLRQYLLNHGFGISAVLHCLAKHFPQGSCKAQAERLARVHNGDVIAKMAEGLLADLHLQHFKL